ncbi:hypothetical protein COCOR_06529 [Corallococcus coralloides DSM 2259]|uniref:Thermostable carboxypeptidase 1 n=1 Tax=Corallococcus coralloides (strain ATCC 25202 / DSM 2259 / NBRC 100086 / M2) TaxID=1144275 RepID=H8MUK4_CORCM|nr:hypothetical protein [Corallococcus coralloides]AFE06980.1 hypothetical protein COCOR_06529 [Corallococcus coralloides DSM 2259]
MDSWLRSRMHELNDLNSVINLASWDREVYLPSKAASARAQQLATVQAIHHERLVDPRLGEALARAGEGGRTSRPSPPTSAPWCASSPGSATARCACPPGW